MKKQALLFVLLSSLLVTGCNNQQAQSTPKGPEVEDLGEKDAHTELMKQYLADPDWESIKTYVPKVNAEDSSYHNDQSQPEAIKLEFAEVEDASKYYVQIAKNVEFKDAKIVEASEKSYNLYNTEIGTDYYYRAAVSEEALANAKIKKFSVKDLAPRYIHVDGVINFRDCGGWKSSLVENGRVKQGLYYRCAQFNSITADGKAALKDLGIKLDIDMRDNPPKTSPASSEDWPISILDARVASGTENIRWEGQNASGSDRKIANTYKKIFEAIANADNEPIALHCTHGADRTGIVSWFLLGLLGVSKEDCARDYVMTRFAGERAVLPNGSGSEIAKWNQKTEALEGATWADKTYKHLNEDFGIDKDTLDVIREKFVPGYVAQ
ncbi:MAG: tyrosine-protein phosphatase [Bacilli bacterium]|nr:tyrosine-protein phosphatase [Bacilli bacterium]